MEVQQLFAETNAFAFPVFLSDELSFVVEWKVLAKLEDREFANRLFQRIQSGPKLNLREGHLLVDDKVIFDSLEFVGKGSHGYVFRSRSLALKIQPLKLAARQDGKTLQLSTSLREAVVLALVSDLPAFPQFYGSFVFSGRHGPLLLLVEEFIDGTTLKDMPYDDIVIEQFYGVLESLREPKDDHAVRMTEFDGAESNIIVVGQQLKLIDHGYTTIERIPGWDSDRVQKITGL